MFINGLEINFTLIVITWVKNLSKKLETKIVIMYEYFNLFQSIEKKVIITRIFSSLKSRVDLIYFFIENSFKLEIRKPTYWAYLKKKTMEKYWVFRNMRNLIFPCGCLMDFNLNKSMSRIYLYLYRSSRKYRYLIKGFCSFF